MPERISYEKEPESEIIYQDNSIDGSLTLTVWRDPGPLTELMLDTDVVSMGMLRIYNNLDGSLLHQERVPLSESSVVGPGPKLDESEYWSSLIDRFIPKD